MRISHTDSALAVTILMALALVGGCVPVSTVSGDAETGAASKPLEAALALMGREAGGAQQSFLILARGDSLPPDLDAAVAEAGGIVTDRIPAIGIAVAVSDDPAFADVAAKIPAVRAVMPNVRVRWIAPKPAADVEPPVPQAADPEDDEFFPYQWGLLAVHAPEAWAKGARGAGVTVAVLDDGIKSDHPDLAPNLDTDRSISFVPDEPAYEYAGADAYSHGCHVAGIIAAADTGTGARYGIVGVAPEATLVMVKVLNQKGEGDFAWILKGIVYAADIGADVINMSFGAYFNRRGLDADGMYVGGRAVAELAVAVGRATNYAYQRGSTLVAALGENGLDRNGMADLLDLPADAAHVISSVATGPCGWSVGSSVDLDLPGSYYCDWYYSDFGQSAVDFAAPGGSWTISDYDVVLSTGSGTEYGISWSPFGRKNFTHYGNFGTSMAAAHVSGVAALIIGRHGGPMDPARVEYAMRVAAEDLGKPGNDAIFGLGRLNAGLAVDCAD